MLASAAQQPPPPPPLPPPPPPPRHTPLLTKHLLRRLELTASSMGAVMVAILWLHTAARTDMSPAQHSAHAAHVLFLLAITCLVWRAPFRFWLKFRVVLISSIRFVECLFPHQRSTSEDMALLLHRPARPGLLGAAADYCTLVLSSRSALAGMFTLVLHQPPLAVLLQQVVHVALTANSRGYCSSELLAHPLSRARMASLWRALELASAVVPPFFSLPGITPDAMGQCRVLVTFNHVIASVVVPTLLSSAILWRHSPWAPADEPDTAAPPSSQRQAPTWQRLLSTAADGMARRWAALEAALQGTVVALSAREAALALVLLSGNLWLLAKLALL